MTSFSNASAVSTFSLSARPVLRAVPLAVATLLLWQDPSWAQAASGDAERVLVTGTRRIDRTVGESESPVDVLSAQDLAASGSTELATVLAQLLPSFNFPRPSVTDASDAVRPAQLRGLSPDHTLVLINGKRRHTTSIVNVNGSQGRGSSPADLNAIPLSAIDRIEVLRDGAAAQYGSDAIAGVVNVILKKGAKGGQVGLEWAQSAAGDGQRLGASASLGLSLGEQAWARLSLETRDQDFTNRAGADLRDPTEPRYGRVNQRLGDPDSTAHAVALNAEATLSSDLKLYGFATLSQRQTSAAATWRTAQTAVGSGVLRSPLYPEGFLPLEDSQTTDTGLVLGLKGELAGWRWDASLNHGRNQFDLDIRNTANLSLGAASPTQFKAGGLSHDQTQLNLDLSREVDVGLAQAANVALGAEWRQEGYDIEAGELNSYSGSGAQGFSGFRPANAGQHSRRSEAVYASIEASFSRTFSATAALRAEHYSDFGSATSGKVSGRYVLSPGLSVRGTASTGFRAPSLAQQYYTITTTNFVVIDGINTPLETGTFAVGSPAAQALGAQPLKAETSRNLSLGVQWQASRDWQTTLDIYQIAIDDRILFSSNLVLPTALRNQLAAQGVLASAARYFTNAVDTRSRGIDVVSTYRQAWSGGWGQSDFSLAYNQTRQHITGSRANPALLTSNNLVLIDRQTSGRATVTNPSSKLNLAVEHRLGDWSLRLGGTHYGRFTVPQNNAALDQTYSAEWVADAALSWRHGAWSATLGADNLNNRYPDKVTSAGNLNTNGIFQYSNFSPFGFNGRQWYARVGYRW